MARYVRFQSSDSINVFLKKYPQSSIYHKAYKLFYDFEYLEQTKDRSIAQYQRFLIQYSKNPNVYYAEKNLFAMISELHIADSIYTFIKKYATILTQQEAWKLLYSISMKAYNKQELIRFLEHYPEYPYSDVLLKEISLSDIQLFAVKNQEDKYGYIDSLGNWKILPIYDDALDFSEGWLLYVK
ncbi:MAG: WG repeat-containing protein [Chitinophagales bacterium]|nr:WG repeat-containing protein [Chitinophagales bacterium]